MHTIRNDERFTNSSMRACCMWYECNCCNTQSQRHSSANFTISRFAFANYLNIPDINSITLYLPLSASSHSCNSARLHYVAKRVSLLRRVIHREPWIPHAVVRSIWCFFLFFYSVFLLFRPVHAAHFDRIVISDSRAPCGLLLSPRSKSLARDAVRVHRGI